MIGGEEDVSPENSVSSMMDHQERVRTVIDGMFEPSAMSKMQSKTLNFEDIHLCNISLNFTVFAVEHLR